MRRRSALSELIQHALLVGADLFENQRNGARRFPALSKRAGDPSLPAVMIVVVMNLAKQSRVCAGELGDKFFRIDGPRRLKIACRDDLAGERMVPSDRRAPIDGRRAFGESGA